MHCNQYTMFVLYPLKMVFGMFPDPYLGLQGQHISAQCSFLSCSKMRNLALLINIWYVFPFKYIDMHL